MEIALVDFYISDPIDLRYTTISTIFEQWKGVSKDKIMMSYPPGTDSVVDFI